MKRFITTHLSPLLAAALLVLMLAPPTATAAETAAPVSLLELCAADAQTPGCDDYDIDGSITVDDDGDVDIDIDICPLKGFDTSVDVQVGDDGGATILVVTVCDYGDCGLTIHVTAFE